VTAGRGASEVFGLFGIGLLSNWELNVTGRGCSAEVVSINAAVLASSSGWVELLIELSAFWPHRLRRGVVAQIMHVSCQTHVGRSDLQRNRACTTKRQHKGVAKPGENVATTLGNRM
jgi:hypothetical protein